jgi:cell fate regulator YaaT (PSP1 superfamily)
MSEKNIVENENNNPTTVEKTEVVGVRFRQVGKVYYFSPMGLSIPQEMQVIVETARGIEIGTSTTSNIWVNSKDIVQPLRPILRIATNEDIKHSEENRVKEVEAFELCKKKIEEHALDMNLIDTEYTFDNNKLLFYFTSDGRVDFRELVKELASIFKTRIELRQIGIRDEAKLKGGLGLCGRPFCCNTFLSDFVQVSIKMAKEQNFSLNSAKISGACGRLMCCLRYEHETYEEEIKKTPQVGYIVTTDSGNGLVIESNPLAGTIKVRLDDKPDQTKVYKREDVKLVGKAQKKPQNKQSDAGES